MEEYGTAGQTTDDVSVQRRNVSTCVQDNEDEVTNTPSVYVTLICFAWRKWLRKGALNVTFKQTLTVMFLLRFARGGVFKCPTNS